MPLAVGATISIHTSPTCNAKRQLERRSRMHLRAEPVAPLNGGVTVQRQLLAVVRLAVTQDLA